MVRQVRQGIYKNYKDMTGSMCMLQSKSRLSAQPVLNCGCSKVSYHSAKAIYKEFFRQFRCQGVCVFTCDGVVLDMLDGKGVKVGSCWACCTQHAIQSTACKACGSIHTAALLSCFTDQQCLRDRHSL